jgi:hypothetical protein
MSQTCNYKQSVTRFLIITVRKRVTITGSGQAPYPQCDSFALCWRPGGMTQILCVLVSKWKDINPISETNLINYMVRDSAVGIVNREGLDGPGIESRWGRDFPHPTRPARGPTHSSWGKATGAWRWPPTPLMLKKKYSYTSTPPPLGFRGLF